LAEIQDGKERKEDGVLAKTRRKNEVPYVKLLPQSLSPSFDIEVVFQQQHLLRYTKAVG
jgi:hypothetical protein